MKPDVKKIRHMVEERAYQGWHKDPLNRISVIRRCEDHETPGMDDLICQCNGQNKDIAIANVDFIAAARKLLKQCCEYIEKLERVADIVRENPFKFLKSIGLELAEELGKAMFALDEQEASDAQENR